MRKRLLASVLLLLGAACSSSGDGESPPPAPGNTAGSGGRGGSGSPTAGTGGGTGATAGSGGGAGTGGSAGAAGSGGSGGSAGGSGGSGGSRDAATRRDVGGDRPATRDGAGSDGPPAATGAPCEGARFCDDFEGQTMGQAPRGMFTIQNTGGSVTVDGAQAFSGGKSVVIKSRGAYPGTFLVFNGIQGQLPGNDLHGRAMIFHKTLPGQAHFDTVIASAAGGGNPTYILGGMYGNFMSVYHPGDCSVDSDTPFPQGKWACVQWQFKGGADGTHLHKMMLDGQVVHNGEQTGNQGVCVAGGPRNRDWRAPTFGQLKVGHVHFGNNTAIEMYIDDLAWGDKPIPCPPPR